MEYKAGSCVHDIKIYASDHADYVTLFFKKYKHFYLTVLLIGDSEHIVTETQTQNINKQPYRIPTSQSPIAAVWAH